jgi:hypothetical protein
MSPVTIPTIGGSEIVHWQGYRWWAERGMIHWENKENGDYGSQSVRITLARLRGVNDMVKNSLEDLSSSGQKLFYHDEVEGHQRYIDQMVELVTQAQNQGQPTDKNSGKDAARRRKKTVVMPGTRAQF